MCNLAKNIWNGIFRTWPRTQIKGQEMHKKGSHELTTRERERVCLRTKRMKKRKKKSSQESMNWNRKINFNFKNHALNCIFRTRRERL